MKNAFSTVIRRAPEFLLWTFVAMFTLYGILSFFDFVPNQRVLDFLFPPSAQETTLNRRANPPTEDENTTPVTPAAAVHISSDATPSQLIIDKLGKTLPINNPATTDLATLDNSLLTGVSRYPESATMKEDGTMLIFGHSSYLAVVHNQNFRAFNGIQSLVWGDLIRVRSDDTEYVYRVENVYQLKATADSIPIEHTTKQLVLVTCNTFGAKEDRYVVEATFVDSYPLKP